jgi:putative transposase
MQIFAWCIMPSHVHLVFKSTIQPPADLLRDFKSYTSKQIAKLIADSGQESRRDWLINSFKKAATGKLNNKNYQFWQQHNQPIILWSMEVIKQKIDYIHDNPVEAGFVDEQQHYLHSSARDYCGIKGLVNIALIDGLPHVKSLR